MCLHFSLGDPLECWNCFGRFVYWEKLGWLLDIGLLDLDYVMFWLIAGGVLSSLLLWFLGGKVKGWFCF